MKCIHGLGFRLSLLRSYHTWILGCIKRRGLLTSLSQSELLIAGDWLQRFIVLNASVILGHSGLAIFLKESFVLFIDFS